LFARARRRARLAVSVMTEEIVWPRIRHFLAGTASGVCLVLAGHPLDTIKVRLQSTQADRFAGPWQCLKETIRNEGFGGLYKGASPPLVMTGFINSIMFGLMVNAPW
jgi:solute carrier family 25 carnitine/acylcarnitine transporter 20/29